MALVQHTEARVLGASLHHPGRRQAHRTTFQYTRRPNYLYVRSRAISSRTNDNHDTFPADEIKAAYASFIGKPVFVSHNNEDVGRLRGVIVDAALHEDTNPDGTPDTWVEVLMEVDASKFPKLAARIIDRSIERTSMGCDVDYSVCSFCGNKATSPPMYCTHIARMKGQRLRRTTASGAREMVLVSEICYGLSFFENSLLVEPPADPTAVVLGVDASAVRKAAARGARASATYDPQRAWRDRRRGLARTASLSKRSYGEVVAPQPVDTLRAESCPQCGDADSFDGERCPVCGYLQPPEQLEDPDLDAAREHDEQEGLFGREPPGAGSQQPPPLDFSGGRSRRGAVGMSATKGRARSGRPTTNAAAAERGRLVAALSGQQEQIRALAEAGQRKDEQIEMLRRGLSTLAQLAGAAKHPRLAKLVREADVVSGQPLAPTPPPAPEGVEEPVEYQTGYSEGELDVARPADVMASTSAMQAWDGHTASWKIGWADGYGRRQAALRRQAADEERDPVAMTSDEALAPDATDDPTSIGASPAGANEGVTPAAATTVGDTDVAIPTEPYNNLIDVTQPAAGADGNVPSPGSAAHVEYDIDATAPTNEVAFPETGWTASKGGDGTGRARLLASLNLARLRMQAGITRQADLLAVADQIDQSDMSGEQIAAEAKTLGRVAGVQQRVARNGQPARRQLVPQKAPRTAADARSVPSLVSESRAGAPAGDDEFLDLP